MSVISKIFESTDPDDIDLGHEILKSHGYKITNNKPHIKQYVHSDSNHFVSLKKSSAGTTWDHYHGTTGENRTGNNLSKLHSYLNKIHKV